MRYPLKPLLEKTGCDRALFKGQPAPIATLATRLGRSHSKVSHAQLHGLSARQADTWATLCGFHPSEVWDSWFSDAMEDA